MLASLQNLDIQRPGHLVLVGSSIAFGGVISVYSFKKLMCLKERRRLRKVTKRKQEERAAAFAELRAKYKLTKEVRNILETPTDQLIDKLQAREVTAKAVLQAFIYKSLQVTEKTNCITEYIPQAVEWAEKLDSLASVKGPLHGIPFCVKDDTDVKGMDSTLGYAKFLYDPATESAAIVKVLRDLGGVPFCRTNVPMSLISFGSSNPIFGTTFSSHFPERKLGPGGSSSGTGSLVGSGGAIFGLGSDIGGSVRIPAHCNGICTLRPTVGRLSVKGVGVRILPGLVGIHGVAGILTPQPRYLALIFKSIVEGDLQRKYDGTVVPVPWNAKMFNSSNSLKIGYYTSIPMFPAIGSTEKTVLRAKQALESRGHTLIPFDLGPESIPQICELFGDFAFADHGKNLIDLHYGEEDGVTMRHLWMLWIPVWIRRIGSALLKWIPGCQELAHDLSTGFNSDTSVKLWKCMQQRDAHIEHVLSCMDLLQLDAVLAPAFPCAALHVDQFNDPKLFIAACYTMIWNLLDMPAGVVRFGTETGKDGRESRSDDSPAWRRANKAIAQSVGMPIGVQVVGKKFEEEMVLRIMNELDDIYQNELLTES